jgi:hypothetical protein
MLAEAEIEVARKLEEAAAIYADNEHASKLKKIMVISEGLSAGNSMVLTPNSIMDVLNKL